MLRAVMSLRKGKLENANPVLVCALAFFVVELGSKGVTGCLSLFEAILAQVDVMALFTLQQRSIGHAPTAAITTSGVSGIGGRPPLAITVKYAVKVT